MTGTTRDIPYLSGVEAVRMLFSGGTMVTQTISVFRHVGTPRFVSLTEHLVADCCDIQPVVRDHFHCRIHWSLSKKKWKDVTAGHESIGPNLILLETEVKNYVATSGLI